MTHAVQLDMLGQLGGIMTTFADMSMMGHEQVVFCRNDDVGLRAIIAIHDTTLGPALGGLRLYNYANESDAIRDALRLSRGMTSFHERCSLGRTRGSLCGTTRSSS